MGNLDTIRFENVAKVFGGQVMDDMLDIKSMIDDERGTYKKKFSGGCFVLTRSLIQDSVTHLLMSYLINREALYIGVFTGEGTTIYSTDTENVRRLIIATPHSVSMFRGRDVLPNFSERYNLEWHGGYSPKQCPIPSYKDPDSITGSLLIKHDNGSYSSNGLDISSSAFVPSLYRTNNLFNLAHFGNTNLFEQLTKYFNYALSQLNMDPPLIRNVVGRLEKGS